MIDRGIERSEAIGMDIAGNKEWMEVKNIIIQPSMRKKKVLKKPNYHLEANRRENRKTERLCQIEKDHNRSDNQRRVRESGRNGRTKC